MTGYRFLSPAEEEMTEASVFYDAASRGLGGDFLDDVQQAIDRVRKYPHVGELVVGGLRRQLLHRFPFSVIYCRTGRDSGHLSRALWAPSRLLALSR